MKPMKMQKTTQMNINHKKADHIRSAFQLLLITKGASFKLAPFIHKQVEYDLLFYIFFF